MVGGLDTGACFSQNGIMPRVLKCTCELKTCKTCYQRNRKRGYMSDPVKRAARIAWRHEYKKDPIVLARCRADSNKSGKKWAAENPERRRETDQRWAKANPSKRLAYSRKYRTGFTPEYFGECVDRQDGKCAICERVLDLVNHRNTHADHDHETGQLRGVLCGGCNKGLGHFRDSVENLKKAEAYLEFWKNATVEAAE